MFHSKIAQAALAATLGLGLAAGAQAGERHRDRDENAAALAAKTSAAQAIAAAEQQTGGRALKVNFENEKGKPAYEVRILSKGALSEVYVDPDTGKVTGTKDKSARRGRDDRAEFSEMASASSSLSAAIHAAEAKTGARALEARIRDIDGIVFYRVEVAKGDKGSKVTVDSAGKVVKISAAEEDEDRVGHHREHERGEHHEHHEHGDRDED